MTVNEACERFGFRLLAGSEGADNVIEDVYVCDLLSWVMGRAAENCAWITIQGHINIIAVATLAGVGCIIVAEGAEISPETLKKAEGEGIPLLTTKLTSYQTARLFALAGV